MFLFGLILTSFAVAAPVPTDSPHFPVGEIISRVDCSDTPGQSYALFLPPGYSREKAWPILYVFDPGARGALGVQTFREAASRYGWILVGSNNARNGAADANLTALRAMWRDTHGRFSIDARRVYSAGFSGAARLATMMATTAPGTIAGVIGYGAGFHKDFSSRPPFAYFGAVGSRDFNFSEMQALGRKLEVVGATWRIVVFDGQHQWPTPEVCGEAVGWMELQAVRARAARDPGPEVDAILAERLRKAGGLESAHPDEALEEYRSIGRDFSGLRDVARANEAAKRLEKSDATARAAKERRKRIEQEERERDTLTPVWAEIRSREAIPLERLVQELHIPDLRKRASARPETEDALSAERLLNEIVAQASLSLAPGYRNEKNPSRELLCLSIATQARPESPAVWYRRAAAYAVAGEAQEALADLETGVEIGFAQPDELEADDDFARLRENERFQRAVAAARANAKKAPR